jgi:D-3-phosphoglycerate dehydrogenase / 2-oxoglutarate reductase
VISCRSNPVNVDVAACTPRGITVATTPARNAEVTADLTIALLLDTAAAGVAGAGWLREGRWTSDDLHEPYRRFRGSRPDGRVLGSSVAARSDAGSHSAPAGFGMEILISDPYLAPDDVEGLARRPAG